MGRAQGKLGGGVARRNVTAAGFDDVLGARRGLSPEDLAARAQRDELQAREEAERRYRLDPALRRRELVVGREAPELDVLICHRDPDHANHILAPDGWEVIDMDLGSNFDGIANIADELGDEDAVDWVQDMADKAEGLPAGSAVRAALLGLLDQSGVDYKVPVAGPDGPARPVALVVRDPDSSNEFTADLPLDVVSVDIAGEEVAAMSAADFDAFADEEWALVAHLDPDHPQRVALLGLLDDLRA